MLPLAFAPTCEPSSLTDFTSCMPATFTEAWRVAGCTPGNCDVSASRFVKWMGRQSPTFSPRTIGRPLFPSPRGAVPFEGLHPPPAAQLPPTLSRALDDTP